MKPLHEKIEGPYIKVSVVASICKLLKDDQISKTYKVKEETFV